jgi:hypothetical protein
MLVSCVSLDELPPGSLPQSATPAAATSTASYPDPEPGFLTTTSTHFTLKGHSQSDLETLKNVAESRLSEVSTSIGLYTFLASQSFVIVVYKDKEEYQKKTQQPEWSQMTTGQNTIYLYYPNANVEPLLAHHLSHLVLRSYMGDRIQNFKWLDEGFAMNRELSMMTAGDRSAYATSRATQLRQSRMAFSHMAFFVTNSEERRRTDVWFQQAESVVSYLLAQGSPLAFAQFLSALRAVEIDQAIADAYPAKFRSFSDLEAAWKYTI